MDENIQINDIVHVSDDMLLLTYHFKTGFLPIQGNLSILIAIFTMSHARIHLYNYLKQVPENCLLYFDTNSVMLVEKDGEHCLPRSSKVGGLKDELLSDFGANSRGSTFCSGGPKTYALKVDKQDGSHEWIFKVKGITLNYRNLQILNPEKMLDTIINSPNQETEVMEKRKIHRDKNTGLLWNKTNWKRWKIVHMKRVIVDRFNTLPYGYYMAK